MYPRITYHSGVGILGGVFFQLEDFIDGKVVRILFDAGINFDNYGMFYSSIFQPRKYHALKTFMRLGLCPEIEGLEGIFRQDELKKMGIRPADKPSVDAAVFTHAHFDHTFLLHFMRPDLDVRMDRYSYEIIRNYQRTSGMANNEFVVYKDSMTFAPHPKRDGLIRRTGKSVSMERNINLIEPYGANHNGKPFKIGPMTVEAFYVDHSLPGACGFIFHTSAGPIAFSGDIRFSGRRKQDSLDFIQGVRDAGCKVFHMEGSLIHKDFRGTEDDVVDEIAKWIREIKGMKLCAYPVRDFDRIKSFYEACKREKIYFVIDARQAEHLERFSQFRHFEYPSLGRSKYLKVLLPLQGLGALGHEELHADFASRDYQKWMRKYVNHKEMVSFADIKADPSKYMVFLPASNLDYLVELEPPEGSGFLRSHPEPYTEQMDLDEDIHLNWQGLFNLLQKVTPNAIFDPDARFNMPQMHINGHSSYDETEWAINHANPGLFVPYHCLFPDAVGEMFRGKKLIMKKEDQGRTVSYSS